jgi:hypothetical protein
LPGKLGRYQERQISLNYSCQLLLLTKAELFSTNTRQEFSFEFPSVLQELSPMAQTSSKQFLLRFLISLHAQEFLFYSDFILCSLLLGEKEMSNFQMWREGQKYMQKTDFGNVE